MQAIRHNDSKRGKRCQAGSSCPNGGGALETSGQLFADALVAYR